MHYLIALVCTVLLNSTAVASSTPEGTLLIALFTLLATP